MNQIFKVIFDKTLGKAVAVSELVKNHGKGQCLQSGSGSTTPQPTQWLPALSKLTVALGLGFVCAVPGVYAADKVGDGSVTVTADEVVEGNVIGKKQSSGTVSNSSATIEGGTIQQSVYGGYNLYSQFLGQVNDVTVSATNNKVTISEGEIQQAVYGGYSRINLSYVSYPNNHKLISNSNNNTVTISGGTIQGNVYGGYNGINFYVNVSRTFSANNNQVTISGGMIQGDVYGGYSDFEGVQNHTVQLNGNKVYLSGAALYNDVSVYGYGWKVNGTSQNPSITVSNPSDNVLYINDVKSALSL